MKKVIIMFTILFVIFNSSFVMVEAQIHGQAKIDSLMKELLKAKQDTNHVKLLSQLSFGFYSTNPDKGIEYGEKGLELSKKINWKEGEANCYISLGVNNAVKSDYPKALEYYHKALKISDELGDKSVIAANLGNIGLIYTSQADYPKALEYYHKSLKIDEELGNKSGIASNLANIGIVYMNQSDYHIALEHFHKALKINEEMGNKTGIANNLINMGSAYSQKGELDKSLEYLKKGLKLNIEIQNRRQTAYTLNMLASNYINQAKMYDSVRTKGESKDYIVGIKIENSYKSALQFAKEAEHLADSIGLTELQPGIFKSLYEVYKELNEPAKALEYHEKYTELNDSIFSMEKTKEIATLEAKKEKEVAEKENIILKTEKKAQQFQSYLLAGGVVLLFSAFALAFIRFREKKKLSDKLSLQKAEIENQKSLLQEKNTEIIDSINYASTIQHALLPWSSVLNKNFKEHFVVYKPKDIVSGDSYWFQEVDGVKYLAVIDCTGHGVPGSMLTVIANSVLDDAVLSKKISSTSEILTYMNEKVTDVLNQRLSENSIRDGMEVALIAIHSNKIQFTGAGRPLFVKNEKFETYKTDKRGIAGQTENDDYQFSSVEIERTENMIVYLASDGFADQMNENSKKYSTKRFVETLERISAMPLNQQKEILENDFNSHKGNREQIDDVTIIGVRI